MQLLLLDGAGRGKGGLLRHVLTDNLKLKNARKKPCVFRGKSSIQGNESDYPGLMNRRAQSIPVPWVTILTNAVNFLYLRSIRSLNR